MAKKLSPWCKEAKKEDDRHGFRGQRTGKQPRTDQTIRIFGP